MSLNTRDRDRTATATKQEIKWMCRFIGGFEKWPILNDDCKQKVLNLLDYNTRLSLGMCSKADYHLMNTTPFRAFSIEVDDCRQDYPAFQIESFDNVSVSVNRYNDWKLTDKLDWVFSQSGEDTLIRWIQNFRRKRPGNVREVILKNCNYYEEAVKFAEKWMKRCQFRMEEIEISMEKYPIEKSGIECFPQCTEVKIVSNRESDFCWWLQKLPRKLRILTLYLRDTVISREFFSSEQIQNTEKLQIRCAADISDAQLLNLKATHIEIGAVQGVTDEGVNQFIKLWVNRKNDFKKLLLKNRPQFDINEMIRGIENIRHWDDKFKKEDITFWNEFHRFWGHGDTYQIPSKLDSFESLTLHIYDNDVSICHTGRRAETREGNPYTDYWVP